MGLFHVRAILYQFGIGLLYNFEPQIKHKPPPTTPNPCPTPNLPKKSY